MPSSGDVVHVELGSPTGSEAGLLRPAVVVTAQRVLALRPRVLQLVPLTSRLRGYDSEVIVVADAANGLTADSAAQCQHVRAVATQRVAGEPVGNVGPAVLAQIRETLAVLLDL